MFKKSAYIFLALVCNAMFVHAQEARLSVKNPSGMARPNEPVVIEWKSIVAIIPTAKSSSLRIIDEAGRLYVSQADDLDQDGTLDELVFLADFEANQTRTFTLRDSTLQFPEGSSVVISTDAQNWKRVDGVLKSLDDDNDPGLRRDQTRYRFDGIGWESEVVGYRVYLDERNAVDIQAKRRPGLHWKFIGSTQVDYQQNSDWGMDPLHVGPALGVGGIAFWVGDSVHKPEQLEKRRARVIARGPVRAVVRVDYEGWRLGNEKANVSSIFTIHAGERVTEHRVLLRGGKSASLVTGIVKHAMSSVTWDGERGQLTSSGKQSRAGDELYLSLQFMPKDVIKKTADAYNDLVVLKAEAAKPVRYLISSVWEGETGKMWSADELNAFQKRIAARLNEPLVITLK